MAAVSNFKLSGCMKIVAGMSEADQDALLERLDSYIGKGVPPEKAQRMAARDMLEEIKAEHQEFLGHLKEQHPDLFVRKAEQVETQQEEPRFSTRRGPAPKNTVKAYKLFRVDARRPGELFPLFVKMVDGAEPGREPGIPIGSWQDAEIGATAGSTTTGRPQVKSKIGALAFRPGWHAGDLPLATHIGGKSSPSLTTPDTRPDNQVWAEVELADDKDWQSEATRRGYSAKGVFVPREAHITDQIPVDGFYRYKTNPNMTGSWLIGGSMKINRILSDAEVKSINAGAGVDDLPREAPFDPVKYGFDTPKQSTARSWYYSQLERSMAQAPDKVFGKGAQVKAWLLSNKGKLGIKDDEIRWTGLDDWLDMQQGKVSKDQVLEFLRGNGVRVEEVEKGTHPPLPQGWRVVEEYSSDPYSNNDRQWVVEDENGEMVAGSNHSREDALKQALGFGETKFGQYVLPGGENYRELLLTLPEKDRIVRTPVKSPRGWGDTEGGDVGFVEAGNTGADFRSGHWGEPNVLAHVRFNDRTDADGKKVLFIEEVQSDWGQQGKKEGFVATSDAISALEEQRDSAGRKLQQLAKIEGGVKTDEYRVLREEVSALNRKIVEMRKGVPAAPFVTDTKAWVSLALKRMISYAAEHGYDRVAFVNGEQSADRYDLSKQISRIDYQKRGDNFRVSATSTEGQQVFSDVVSPSKLEDTVGKEVAQKIIDGQGAVRRDMLWPDQEGPYKRLSGLDLKVGGEGMKAFYDEILPQVANSVLKKLGGGKVGTVELGALEGTNEYGESIDESVNGTQSGTQPGFDITPKMREMADVGLPLFSPARTSGQADALAKLSLETPAPSLGQRMRDTLGEFGDKDWYKQELLDRFHGIKVREGDRPADHSAYVATRLSTGVPSIMRGILMHGAPEWMNDVRLQKIVGSKGLLDILDPVKEDLNGWLGWMVGKRAERLKQQGKENLLDDTDIQELIALAGPAGGQKEQTYRAVSREFAAFKRSILDVTEKAGVIDGTTRPMWDQLDWIPFFRVMDEDDVSGPRTRGGLSGQRSGIKKLTGGKSNINDPLENIVMSFYKLIDASVKNNAIRLAKDNMPALFQPVGMDMTKELIPLAQVKKTLLDAGVDPVVVARIPSASLQGLAKMWSVQAPTDPDVVRIMEGGKAKYYKVEDPLLLGALTAWEPLGNGILMQMGRASKGLVTHMTTSTPGFIVRNFIRDSLSAGILAPHGHSFADALRGAYKSMKETGGFEDMLFAGASFAGGYIEGENPRAAARQIRRSFRDAGFRESLLDTPAKLWTGYQRLGEAAENANRESIYEATLRATQDRTLAAFEAKDIMDFSMVGRARAMRTLSAVIPFMNARIQGVYRLSRTENYKALAIGGMKLLGVTMALWFWNRDDPEYQALEDWDKNTYWHLKRPGGGFYRVPKPFELGAIFGTIPERIANSWYGNDTWKKGLLQMAATIADQFNFTGGLPIPQIVKPMYEVATNKNSFTGRGIENHADEGKLPQARYNEQTSDTMRLLADKAAPVANATGMSPKRAEHLVKGYFGAMAAYPLGLLDMLVHEAQGKPSRGAMRLDDIPEVKSFVEISPAKGTVYQTDLYEMWNEVQQIKRTKDEMLKQGRRDDAVALINKDIDKLKMYPVLQRSVEALTALRHQADAIIRKPDAEMSPEEKRRRLDIILEKRNMISRAAASKAREAF